jgi:hypothetical protein
MKSLGKLFLLCLLSSVLKPSASDHTLSKSFQTPPDSAKPQTWWHWMSGNISREGITADIEAMKQVDIGGATFKTP